MDEIIKSFETIFLFTSVIYALKKTPYLFLLKVSLLLSHFLSLKNKSKKIHKWSYFNKYIINNKVIKTVKRKT